MGYIEVTFLFSASSSLIPLIIPEQAPRDAPGRAFASPHTQTSAPPTPLDHFSCTDTDRPTDPIPTFLSHPRVSSLQARERVIRKSKEVTTQEDYPAAPSIEMADEKDSAAAIADGADEELGYKIPEQKGWSCMHLFCHFCFN